MNSTLLFVLGFVIIAVLVIVALIVFGLRRKKTKTVSFEPKAEEPKQLTQQEKSGNYQAQGGFNFAPAKKEAEVLPGQELKLETEVQANELSAQLTSELSAPKTAAVEEPVAEAKAEPVIDSAVVPPTLTPSVTPGTHTTVSENADVPNASAADAKDKNGPETDSAPRAGAETTPAEEPTSETAAKEKPAWYSDTPIFAELEHATIVEDLGEPDVPIVEVVDTDEESGTITVVESTPKDATEEPLEAAVAAATVAEAAEQALEEVAAPEPVATTPEPVPAAKPTEAQEEIDPAAGRIGRLRGRLARSQNVFGKSVLGMLTAGDLDDEAWEDIEAQLIQADLGVKITMNVVEDLREMIAERGVSSESEARAMLRECLIKACKPELDRSIKAMPYQGKPAVVLMVGVNGTGKTTTTGKLARVLVSMGHKVLLGAADTFRAAAADQLEAWARRVGAEVVRGPEGADPASVAFDAVAKGIETGADVVVIDTAGRLHNSANLMDQLGKVKRVVEKKTEVDEVLLVIDATTGQNGLTQAKVFGEVVQITGVVLTKLDGTAKGGIVFQVQEDLGVPVKLVGLGEGADHLAPFEVEGFVDALLG